MSDEGTHYFHEDIEFWAEHGLLYVVDHRADCKEDERFKAITRRDALKRAAVLSVEAKRIEARTRVSASSSGNKIAAEDRKRYLDCVENLVASVKQAKEQGDPMDPRVVEDLRKARRKSVLIPGESAQQIEGSKAQSHVLLGNGVVAGTAPRRPKIWSI